MLPVPVHSLALVPCCLSLSCASELLPGRWFLFGDPALYCVICRWFHKQPACNLGQSKPSLLRWFDAMQSLKAWLSPGNKQFILNCGTGRSAGGHMTSSMHHSPRVSIISCSRHSRTSCSGRSSLNLACWYLQMVLLTLLWLQWISHAICLWDVLELCRAREASCLHDAAYWCGVVYAGSLSGIPVSSCDNRL